MEVRPFDWGGLGGLEALDPGLPQLTPLYRVLAEALKDEGFVEREDLFGAPYDFRLAGDGLDQVGDRSAVITIRNISKSQAAAGIRRAARPACTGCTKRCMLVSMW